MNLELSPKPAHQSDQPLIVDGGAPVDLPAAEVAWLVTEGEAEVYLLSAAGRDLLAVAAQGDAIFPLPEDSGPHLQIVTAGKLCLDPITPGQAGFAEHAIAWITRTAGHLAGAPTNARQLAAPDDIAVSPDEVLTSEQLVFLTPRDKLELDLCDTGTLVHAPDVAAMPRGLWHRTRGTGSLSIHAADDVSEAALMRAAAVQTEALVAVFQRARTKSDQATLQRLTGTLGADAEAGSTAGAILQIAAALNVDKTDLSAPPTDTGISIPALCRLSGLRAREIMLEEGWHRRDQGALLVGREDQPDLEALVWDGAGYRSPGGARLTETSAARYDHIAYVVTAPLPASVKGLWSLAFHIMRQGNRRDAAISALAAASAAGLGILVPMATAWLLSDIVPAGIPGLLFGVGVALAAAALVTTILGTARSLATTRIAGRGATALNAALTDRLLRLPVSFYKNYSPGDLNQRLQSVEAMRELAVSVIMSAGLTAVLSVTYLVVLFVYDAKLALIGLVLVAGYIAAVILARMMQMEAIREGAQLDGEIAGLTYETLDGIAKLRAAAAEERAMARWLDVYRRERQTEVRAGRVSANFRAFADAYQTLTLMLLFAGAGALTAAEAPAGIFIGFLAAFGSFQGAFIGLSEALLQVYTAQPLVERAKPILEAETELSAGQQDPGALSGAIEGAGLTFAYDAGLPPVLNRLDFKVRPGEHMAIVGGSGSGKSTLLRLLLGFETPQTGAILYDGQELAHLDLTRVRGQIGVVLQASQLFAGSILENIRGASNVPLRDCLDAAERAGLKRDLEYFAMGIHTPITEGANALSGGQRQRILIARALAAQPNILFFDEATSALDNATQAVVSETLDTLKVTRITIAHRLSTVRHADRICVLQDGKFIEQGAYQELMNMNGAFAELARRQLTED